MTGEVITDQSMQLQRWVEHYLELYSTQNIVTDTALNALPGLSVIEELDNTPTLEELGIAINSLACGKALWKEGIPPEVLKHGKQTILQPLHELLCLCCEQGHIPQDMRDSSKVTVYENKGDRRDCNNYCGISLLSIFGIVFAWVTLTRLQSLALQVYPSSQCDFRAGRSTVDMIFSLRQLQQKGREQQQPLFLAFVDLTKDFDLVSTSRLFKILQKIGCPPKLLAIITSFHQDMQSMVCFDGATSNAFPVGSAVKQDCVFLQPCSGFSSHAAPVCLCRLYRSCLHPDELRRRTLQHCQSPPVSAPKPKLTWCSYGGCCLQTMLL